MNGRTYNNVPIAIGIRFGFNGQERDNETFTDAYDFGARILDTRLGRWLALDPLKQSLESFSGYSAFKNSPIIYIDPDGKWDIIVHSYTQRGKMGYAVMVLNDKYGNEVSRYTVRVVGGAAETKRKQNPNTNENLRIISDGDTPTGIYDIQDSGEWWRNSDEDKPKFGNSFRLAMVGISGEIMKCGKGRRTQIRAHAGRQERGYTGKFDPKNKLKWTNGCIRMYQKDLDDLKNKTDLLEKNDNTEKPGLLEVKDDLKTNNNKDYFIQKDVDDYNKGIELAHVVYQARLIIATEEYYKDFNYSKYKNKVEEAGNLYIKNIAEEKALKKSKEINKSDHENN